MAHWTLGNPWGSNYTLHADEGDVTLAGYDNGMNVKTPESQAGWDLVHVADDPQGEADVILLAGKRFRFIA